MLDVGWSAGGLKYGGGLFEGNYVPTKNSNASFFGHDGETYGFRSHNGYYESIEAGISLIAN